MDHFATKPIRAERLALAIESVQAGFTSSRRAEAAEAAGIDHDVLAELARTIGIAPTAALVQAFIESAPRHLADLHALALHGQGLELARQARQLGSAARRVGLAEVARACATVESDAVQPDAAPLRPPLDHLAAVLHAGLRDLREWRPAPAEQAGS
jgi:HPt (histidine-containing phosphotransfer) domain-containing protein